MVAEVESPAVVAEVQIFLLENRLERIFQFDGLNKPFPIKATIDGFENLSSSSIDDSLESQYVGCQNLYSFIHNTCYIIVVAWTLTVVLRGRCLLVLPHSGGYHQWSPNNTQTRVTEYMRQPSSMQSTMFSASRIEFLQKEKINGY